MADIDLGLAVGALGFGTALLSLVYARHQAEAARLQAQGAVHSATLAGDQEMYHRLREIRSRSVTSPAVQRAVTESDPGRAVLIEKAGGYDEFILYRDFLDSFHEIFFLRKNGVISDEAWQVWAHAQIPLMAGIPPFRDMFAYSAKQSWYHADFVHFFQHYLDHHEIRDPRPKP